MSVVTATTRLAGRNLLLMRRNPATIVGAAVAPVVFFLGFYAVLDRLMSARGIDYPQYFTPAVAVQAMFFAAIASGVYLAQDVRGGMLDRARSLPIARIAPLAGRLLADLTRGLVSLAVLLVLASAFGFRFASGALPAVGFVLLALLFSITLSAGCGAVALASRNPEAAVQSLLLPYLPLLMLSTGFVTVDQFPGWMQPFVRYQPISHVVDALRALSTGGETAGPVLAALAWCLGLLVLFGVLGARAYRRSVR